MTDSDTVDTTRTLVYATRTSNFSIEVPVVVFFEELAENSLYLLTEREAVDQFNGLYGYLTFSLDNVTLVPENNLALFESWEGTIYEIGSNDTVFFAPVIYTDVYISGTSQYEFVGGFDGTS